jgi:hypothetical protein
MLWFDQMREAILIFFSYQLKINTDPPLQGVKDLFLFIPMQRSWLNTVKIPPNFQLKKE